MELVDRFYETGSPSESNPSMPLVSNGGDPEWRDVFHVAFDPAAESPTEVVINAVAVVHDEEPDELAPLYAAVDPEALDELVAPSPDDRPGVDEVRFVYEGLDIVVAGSGHLWLRRR